jgi:hypothetical protein
MDTASIKQIELDIEDDRDFTIIISLYPIGDITCTIFKHIHTGKLDVEIGKKTSTDYKSFYSIEELKDYFCTKLDIEIMFMV